MKIRMVTIAMALGMVLANASAQHAAASTLPIGQVSPLSGPAGSLGTALTQATQAYFARVNAERLLGARQAELMVRDDAFKPEETLRHARELVEEHGVLALLNVTGAPHNGQLHTTGLLGKSSTSVVGAFTGSASVRALRSPYIQFVRAGVADEARAIARQLAALGITRVALLRADDTFGEDASRQLIDQLGQQGLKLSAEVSYAPASADVSAAVARFRAIDLQTIVVFGTPRAGTELLKQYRQAGGAALFIFSSASDAESIVAMVGPELARGVGLVQVVPPVSRLQLPIVQEYRQTLARYGPPEARPSSTGLEGYIAAKLLVQAIRRAGDAPTPARVTAALSSLGPVDLGGFVIDLSKVSGPGARYTEIGIIGDGGRLRN